MSAEKDFNTAALQQAESEGMKPPVRLPHWLRKPKPDQSQLSVANGEGMIDRRGSRHVSPKTIDGVKRGNQGGRPSQRG